MVPCQVDAVTREVARLIANLKESDMELLGLSQVLRAPSGSGSPSSAGASLLS